MSPRTAQTVYLIGTLLTSVIGIILLRMGLSQSSVDAILAGIGALLGSLAPALAAKRVGKQMKDGQFDPAPNLSPSDHIELGVNGLQQVQSEIDRAKSILVQAAQNTPSVGSVIGPITQQILEG